MDQIFIGRGIGFLENGATNVVFPVTIIALSLSLLVGDGCAAFLSICQGRMDVEQAHKSAGNTVGVITASAILLTLIFAVFRDRILVGFGATANNMEYFSCLVMGIPFFMFISIPFASLRHKTS